MVKYQKVLLVFVNLFFYSIKYVWGDILFEDLNVITSKSYAYWPNGTIPFYIHPEHFDHEQALTVMTTLSMFAFKTCLKFVPVMTAPEVNQHVMSFINPEGKRRCQIKNEDHENEKPHEVILGYECLQSPNIDMMIMRALGFPFEHNRADRDLHIEVLEENIEPGYIELYNKDPKLPRDLSNLPYDVNSVMHFGVRDYSKNGHRTIIFKDHKIQQQRTKLTQNDLRKIEIVYGPECRNRDRQEKIELCQSYPGVARRKRNVEDVTQNLRVNRDITPPPMNVDTVTQSLRELGIEDQVQETVDQVYKILSQALRNARTKYCNNTGLVTETSKLGIDTDSTKPENLDTDIKGQINSTSEKVGSDVIEAKKDTLVNTFNDVKAEDSKHEDMFRIVAVINDFAKAMVNNALRNLTEYCSNSKSVEFYQRARCSWNDGSDRCRQSYRSTKSGLVRHSTQHRPVYIQSTKHDSRGVPKNFVHFGRRASETNQTTDARRKRSAGTANTEAEHVESTTEVNKASDVTPNKGSREALRMRTQSLVLKSRPVFTDDRRFFYKGKNRSKGPKTKTLVEEENTSSVSLEKDTPKKKSKSRNREKKQLREVFTKKEELSEEISSKMQKHKKKNKKKEGLSSEMIKKNRSKLPKIVELSKANQEFYKERQWPGGLVPYVIQDMKDFDLEDMRGRLKEVNDILKAKTCVKTQEITEKEAVGYEDYLVLNTSPDYVTGRVGGRQNFGCLELFNGGQHRQHAAMMVMAMLGFYFEVARHDRDRYIRVHMRHVRPDKLHHFEKIRSEATLPFPYDYKSATHPAWQFWRKIGKTGISTVATFKQQDPDGSVMRSLGQNEEILSEIDIVKINSVYGTACFVKQNIY